MERLEIRDVTLEIPSGKYLVRALDKFNAEVRSGELVLLLGPSGCGKTTLLACIAGLSTPTGGQILLDGTSITTMNPKDRTSWRRRQIGLVFEGAQLVPSLTARENIEAPLRLARVPSGQARARGDELLARFGLTEAQNQRPGAMTAGRQQQVAIARALAHDPSLIVVDEPTAALDYVQGEPVIRALRELASPGRAVVVATRDHRLVPLADRVIRMDPRAPGAEPGQIELTQGQYLFEQGDLGELVYVVADGQIDIVRRLADGGEAHLRTCGKDEYFGELAPLLNFPRSAGARARTNAVVHGLTVEEFRERVGVEGVRKALSPDADD